MSLCVRMCCAGCEGLRSPAWCFLGKGQTANGNLASGLASCPPVALVTAFAALEFQRSRIPAHERMRALSIGSPPKGTPREDNVGIHAHDRMLAETWNWRTPKAGRVDLCGKPCAMRSTTSGRVWQLGDAVLRREPLRLAWYPGAGTATRGKRLCYGNLATMILPDKGPRSPPQGLECCITPRQYSTPHHVAR